LREIAYGSKSLCPRAPDSEVVNDRLKLLASAIGVKRSEVVDIDAPSRRS
jgi:hypothetical protein